MPNDQPPLLQRPRLPANRAFVVQFLDEANAGDATMSGRVEHLTSGRSARFNDVDTLMDFIRETLAIQLTSAH